MAIKFCPLLAALPLCAQVLSVNSHAVEPKFEDYKVDSIFAGPNHALDVPDQGEDNWKIYRTNAIKRKVNFAGHYIVFTGSCGGGAICGEILDAKTGKLVSGYPNAYELDSPDGSYYDAGFRPDSRLLMITGTAADPEKDQSGKVLPRQNRTRYFELQDQKLRLVKIE
ncbi:hypothetical protein ACFPTX_11165 [Pseudomonas sp. GCM10022188]|uniref:hypothetical protein n=1 Tax=Pseudomonas TaxID=286 RepID=UPI001E63BE7B|nr:hypothetical protein [Pseudomonas oryzagri]MCC6074549.1 hypothetical protein [Pseudomonas oryzagri]